MQIDMVLLDAKCCPTKAHPTDAGYDLKSANDDVILAPGDKVFFNSGIKVDIPAGYVGLVFPRSGLGTKKQLVLANSTGVIDAHYTGEIIVCLTNKGSAEVSVAKYDRIAQIVFLPIPNVQLGIVKTLKNSERGEKGHGSSGK